MTIPKYKSAKVHRACRKNIMSSYLKIII